MYRLPLDLPQRRVRLEPAAAAGRALGIGPVARQQHPDVHLVGLGFQPLEEVTHAIPGARPGLLPALPLRVAFEHPLPVLRRQLVERHVQRHAVLRRQLFQIGLALAVGLGLPRFHRAAAQRLAAVRNDQTEIDADHAAEAAAGFAGTDRRIEREGGRHGRAVGDVAVGAVQRVRERPALAALAVQQLHVHAAVTQLQRRLDRFGDARFAGVAGAEAVLHHLQHIAVARVDAGIALALQPALHFGVGEVVGHGDRRGHRQPRVTRCGGALGDPVRDAVGGVGLHRLAAAAAVQRGHPREQQLQVVVQFGHRADRGARGAHLIGLVDRDRRRHAFDAVHLRRVHAVEELPRVGREGFDVAALAFGVQRVEHQRGLAGARHAGHHGEPAEREIDVEVLQIVLPHAAQADGSFGRGGHGTIAFAGHDERSWVNWVLA